MQSQVSHGAPTTARMVTCVHGHEFSKAIALRAALPMVSPDAPVGEVHLAMEGVWCGHPSGEFEFSRDTFARIVSNYEAQTNPIPFTYEHPEKDTGQPVPASGWVQGLEIRDCPDHGVELWAKVEFTRRAAEMIKAGEYRYCSVVVDFEALDRMTAEEIGAELFEVGLTNTPFLDGQHAIQFSRRRRRQLTKGSGMDIKQMITQVLKELPDGATIEQFQAVLAAEVQKMQALDGGGDGGGDAAPADKAAASAEPDKSIKATDEPKESMAASGDTVELQDGADAAAGSMADQFLTDLAGQLGMDLPALLALMQERADQIVALLQGTPDSGTAAEQAAGQAVASAKLNEAESRALSKRLKDSDARVAELSKKVSELEWERTVSRVSAAIESGQFLDDDRDELLELAKEAPKVFEKKLAKAKDKPAVPTERVHKAKPPESAGEPDKDRVKYFEDKYFSNERNSEKRRKLAVRAALLEASSKEDARA